VLGSDDAKDAIEALKHAAGKLRQMLGKAMRMRYIPQLRFEQDRALIEGSRISALINRAVAEDTENRDD
jgi:ribosome-binding factor A